MGRYLGERRTRPLAHLHRPGQQMDAAIRIELQRGVGRSRRAGGLQGGDDCPTDPSSRAVEGCGRRLAPADLSRCALQHLVEVDVLDYTAGDKAVVIADEVFSPQLQWI